MLFHIIIGKNFRLSFRAWIIFFSVIFLYYIPIHWLFFAQYYDLVPFGHITQHLIGRAGLLLTVRKSRLAPTKVDWQLSRLASAEVVQCPWESPYPRLGSPHLRLLGLSDQPAIHWSSGRKSRVEYLWRIRPARSCKTNGGRRNLRKSNNA